jgi:ribosomal protein L7/L12
MGNAEELDDVRERLRLIEARLEQIFTHLRLAPREPAAAGGFDPTDDPEIQDLLAKGNEMQAVKRYHDLTGLGITESKAAIDRAKAGG